MKRNEENKKKPRPRPDPGFKPCPKCKDEHHLEITTFRQYKPAEAIIRCGKCGFSIKAKGFQLPKLCKQWNALCAGEEEE